MSTVLLPMKRLVELPPRAAGVDADVERVLLGAWRVGALLLVAGGVLALPDGPGPEEPPWLIGAVPVAALVDVASVSFEGVVVPTT